MKIFNKNIKKLAVGALTGLALVASSCTDDFDDLNTDKTRLTADQIGSAELSSAFAQAQYNGVGYAVAWRQQLVKNLFADVYGGYFSVAHPNFPSGRYTLPGGWLNGGWDAHYSQAAASMLMILDITGQNNDATANAVASIWKVYTYIPMTDQWGPIPYSSVGSGESSIAYDSQESIYTDFFRTLDKAVADLEAHRGETVFSGGDLIYNGSVEHWLRFANTLRLRIAMRVSGVAGYSVDGQSPQQIAEAAVASGVIEDVSGLAQYPTSGSRLNSYSVMLGWGADKGEFRMSSFAESVLKGYEDPRLSIYYRPSDATGDYEGLSNGLSSTELGDADYVNMSPMGERWRVANGSTTPMRVMSSAEASFLRAEGALKGWNMGGSAQQFYEQGIRLSMEEWGGIDAGAIDAYISSEKTPVAPNDFAQNPAASDIPVKFGANGADQLEQIITQKWIALYPNGYEAWAEFRRTGFPKIYLPKNNDAGTNGYINRLLYPDSEASTNSAELQKGIQLLGTNSIEQKVWWDVN